MKRIGLFIIIAMLVFVQNDVWAQRGEVRGARRRGITSGVTAVNQSLPSELSPAPAKRSLTDINLLKYAFIDSKTRVVTLVGSYDLTYATGPIPYYDLLKEVLESPYPYFSLEPTQATRSAVDNLQANIASDTQRMFNDRAYVNEWTQRLMSLLLRDPQLQQDHYRFVKKAADAFKVSNDEVIQILSLTNGDFPSPEMQVIMIKVLKGMGYNNVAFMLEHADGSRETARIICTRFGRINEIEPIWAKWDAHEITDAQARIEIKSRLYGAYLLELGVPAAEVSAKENAVRSGSMSMDELEKFYTDKLTASIVDNIGVKMFNGVTLSQALLSKLYNVPLPQMELVFKNLPAQTNLAKVMFEADYMLKSLTALPDVKEKVPGHLTNLEYLEEESIKQGIRTPAGAGGEVRNTLLPGNVKMRISPGGKVVAFDDAQVKIESALLKPVGNLGSAETLVRNSFTAYGNFLTGRYDLYARVYPPFHRMREVEKLIALARWAKANNYKLVVDRSEGSKVSLPVTASGFWNAIFAADQQEVSLTVVALGGADFSQQYGDSWAQSSSDPAVENSAVKQLVASTAFAQKAAEEAVAGNLENARDLAEKSAQAMVGNIDPSQIPALNIIPVTPEPQMVAVLDVEAQEILEKDFQTMEKAKEMLQQADSLPAGKAAQLREEAEKQQGDAEADLKRLNEALASVRQNPAQAGDIAVALHSGAEIDLRPQGTPFFGLGGGGKGSEGQTVVVPDTKSAQLQNLRHGSYFAVAAETATTENVPVLLDKALKSANGDQSFIASIPANTAAPAINEKGLLVFEKANSDYIKSSDEVSQYTKELESAKAKGDHEAWLKVKDKLDAAKEQEYKAKEEAIRVLRALATGKDPATFHPPIASLPQLDELTWLQMQKQMFEERKKLDERMNKLQKDLAYKVPALKGRELVHEGVILGFGTDPTEADNMFLKGVSPFNGKSYQQMKNEAEQAAKEGRQVGGALVVSFGTLGQKGSYLNNAIEFGRAVQDHFSVGEHSLNTPQAKAALAQLNGKEFDRLIAHSNGASVTEALIRNDVIKVNELNIVGGDGSLLRGHEYQELVDSGKVKRVVVWINVNDPIPGVTSLDQLKLAERSVNAAEHLSKKILGDLAAGDTKVKYHLMIGPTNKEKPYDIFYPHYVQEGYYPNIAKELGVDYHAQK